MFDVADGLRVGIEVAHQRLSDAQSALARANAGVGGRYANAAMARCAQAAIFEEALLGAEHGRFAEIKAVTR